MRRFCLMLLSAGLLVGCGGDSPTKPGTGGLTAAQTALIGAAGGAAFDVKTLAEDAVKNVASAVEIASEASGGAQLTLTGTLTESGPGTGLFTWAAQPTDRMVVAFNGGPVFTINITAFEGFLGGSATDFLESHSNFRFHITAPNLMNLDVASQAGAPTVAAPTVAARGLSPTAGTTLFVRHTTGTVVDDGTTLTVDLTNQGNEFSDFSGSFVELESSETLTGTISSGSGTITVQETDSSHSIFNGDSGTHVVNFHLNGASRAQLGNDLFVFQNVAVAREFTNDRISEPTFWQATGQLLKNGAVIGQVDWSAPPTEGTTSANSPHAVVKLAAGGTIDL